MFHTGAKIYLSEKNILGLGAFILKFWSKVELSADYSRFLVAISRGSFLVFSFH